MRQLTKPTEEAVTADVKRVVQVGVSRARRESLSNLDAIVDAWRRAQRKPGLDLAELLKAGLARIEDAGVREPLAVLLDVRETHDSLAERQHEVAAKAGFAITYLRQEKRNEWCGQLAGRLLDMFDEARELVRERFPVDDALREGFAIACTLAGVQLAAMRRADGSWPAAHGHEDGDISVTARAGAALHKAFGNEWAHSALHDTLVWVEERRDQHGRYGNLLVPNFFPGFPPRKRIVPSPQQTASAIKLVHQFEGPRTRAVARGVVRLIEQQIPERGWSQSGDLDDESDVLATAYVVDALALVTPGIRHMLHTLDRSEAETLETRYDRSLRSGLDWLGSHRIQGGWALPGDNAPHPSVTAHVLGFAWQVVVPRLDPTPARLQALTTAGGIPAEPGGPPAIAPTAMTLLGLMRAASQGYEDEMTGWARYLARATGPRPAPRLDVYAATFLLLLGQPLLEWLSGTEWQERTRGAIETIFEGRAEDAPPEAIADAAADRLLPGQRHVRDVLVELL